ncbi:MAG: HEAT repeat domain-containing protein [Phycisphaerales bacterium]
MRHAHPHLPALLPLAALLSLAGCGESSRRAGPPLDTHAKAAASSPAGAAEAPRMTALERSQVREMALTAITKSAASPSAEERANALEAMLSAPGRVEPMAQRALMDESAGVRAVAAKVVGRAKLTRLTRFVEPLLNDPSPFVRVNAIYALSRCGRPIDPAPLASALRDPRPAVRAETAFVLGELGNPSALSMLRDAAKDPMPLADPGAVRLMRLQLAEAMVKLGDLNAIEEIRAALYPSRPEDLEATALAVQIIGQVNDEKSAYQLKRIALMNDQRAGAMPAEVRLGCAGVLAKIGLPRGEGSFIADEFAANQSPSLRAQSAAVYGATGRAGNLPRLREMLSDPEPLVRVAAAAAIVKITDAQSLAGAQ